MRQDVDPLSLRGAPGNGVVCPLARLHCGASDPGGICLESHASRRCVVPTLCRGCRIGSLSSLRESQGAAVRICTTISGGTSCLMALAVSLCRLGTAQHEDSSRASAPKHTGAAEKHGAGTWAVPEEEP